MVSEELFIRFEGLKGVVARRSPRGHTHEEPAQDCATPPLGRLSRDPEDIAHHYKHLTFSGVRLLTLSEGWISEIHIGLGGTVGALYVRQMPEKTHRSLRGRIEAGKSAGGLTYG